MKLKLLTFNTLGTPFFAKDITTRYKRTAEIINNSAIDIVCLQELFSVYNKYLFDKWLTNYPYKIAKYSPFGVYGGLAIYSKVPISFEEFHLYSYPQGTAIPFYTRLAKSGILVCKLQDVPLRLATTHLTTDTVHNITPKNKRYNLIRSQILQAADLFTHNETSIVLTGDFNTAKNSMLYNEFLKTTDAIDSFSEFDDITYSPQRTPYRFPAEVASRIDFIFYKQHKNRIKMSEKSHMFTEKEVLSDGKSSYLSDHIGLTTTLELIYLNYSNYHLISIDKKTQLFYA